MEKFLFSFFMLDKLLKIKAEYAEIQQKLSDPNVVSDRQKYQDLARKESQLRPVTELIEKYEKALKTIEDSGQLLEQEKDPEMLAMAKEELADAKTQKEALEEELKIALLPKDPNDSKNVIVEVRDKYHNPVPGIKVTLVSSRQTDEIIQPEATNENGISRGRVSSRQKGRSVIRGVISGMSFPDTAQVVFE